MWWRSLRMMLYYGAKRKSRAGGIADALGITLSQLFKTVEKRAEQ
jgi:hypothetical protein